MWLSAYLEADTHRPITDNDLDPIIEHLARYSASTGTSPAGYFTVQMSLNVGDDLRQATDLAVLAVTEALGKVGIVHPVFETIEIMTEREFQRRQTQPPMPILIGSHEAAELLGVSKQYVTSIAARLGGQRVGNSLVFPRSTVEAAARAK